MSVAKGSVLRNFTTPSKNKIKNISMNKLYRNIVAPSQMVSILYAEEMIIAVFSLY